MVRFHPKSIVQLILIGFAAVLGLLITAVVTAVVQVDRLAQQNRDVVRTAETATQQARSLVERLTEMERSLGHFQVLGDERSYETYLDRRGEFRNAAANLAALDLGQAAVADLEQLLQDEQKLYRALGAGTRPAANGPDPFIQPGVPTWDGLSTQARAILSQSSTIIGQRTEQTLSRAGNLQRALVLQAVMVIPATIAVAAVFIVLITRPMRRISDSIRQLGANDLSSPIAIQGPQDLEEVGEQLDWLRKRIRELEHQRMSFVRHMSHELKTPLTAIREGAELLAEGQSFGKTEEDRELTQIIRDNSLHLQKLIEDLLQFGKTLDPVTALKAVSDVRLTDVVEAVLAGHGLSLVTKKISVRRDLAEVSVRGDEDKLRIVVENLLTNAIKFTPMGGQIAITLRAQSDEAVLDLQDSGPGIAEDEKKLIFEPFYQGPADYQAHVKGTGLGLAIVKEYVEAHHGNVQVLDSAVGAHLRVRLPIAGPTTP